MKPPILPATYIPRIWEFEIITKLRFFRYLLHFRHFRFLRFLLFLRKFDICQNTLLGIKNIDTSTISSEIPAFLKMTKFPKKSNMPELSKFPEKSKMPVLSQIPISWIILTCKPHCVELKDWYQSVQGLHCQPANCKAK